MFSKEKSDGSPSGASGSDLYQQQDLEHRASNTRRKASLDDFTHGRNDNAEDDLAALGYTQELTRSRSTLNVAFMSFVLASVPYGLSTTLYYPLVGGGPTTLIWGWCLVCLLMMAVAVSLGEITSVCHPGVLSRRCRGS